MNKLRTIETLSADEFEHIVEQFIEKAAAWDGALPAETFLAAWDELADEAPALRNSPFCCKTCPFSNSRYT